MLAQQRDQAANRQLYEVLRTQILTGQLKPGAALSEARVAVGHGVSRTPVREVFRRLAEEGFLRVVPQVGTFIAPIKLAAVRDSQFVRETLECRAIAMAAATADADGVVALRRRLQEQACCIAAGNPLGFFAADEDMHRQLMAMAGHPTVWDLVASAKTQLDRVRFLSLESPDWLEMIYGQHARIIDLVEASDVERAVAAMREHLRTAFAAIDRIAHENSEFFDASCSGGTVTRTARRSAP